MYIVLEVNRVEKKHKNGFEKNSTLMESRKPWSLGMTPGNTPLVPSCHRQPERT